MATTTQLDQKTRLFRVTSDSNGVPDHNVKPHTTGGLISDPRNFINSWLDEDSVLVGSATNSRIIRSKLSGDFRSADLIDVSAAESRVYDSYVKNSSLTGCHISGGSNLSNLFANSCTLIGVTNTGHVRLYDVSAQATSFDRSTCHNVDACISSVGRSRLRHVALRDSTVGDQCLIRRAEIKVSRLGSDLTIDNSTFSGCNIIGASTYSNVSLSQMMLGALALITRTSMPEIYALPEMVQVSEPLDTDYLIVYPIVASRKTLKAYGLKGDPTRYTYTSLTKRLRESSYRNNPEIFRRLTEIHKRSK